MRTAIVSDLHLGLASGGDLVRDAGVREVLLAELAGADRVVLLGDVVELRERPLAASLALARPFFEELGEALRPGTEVVLVPGNHDHRLAEPLLEAVDLEGGRLGLEHRAGPAPGPLANIDGWLGAALLGVAYPGLWIRDDVYATHGHYMDAHLNLPRAECLAAALSIRLTGGLGERLTPADYERVLRPIYGLTFGFAQGRSEAQARSRAWASEGTWEALAGMSRPRSWARKAKAGALRAGFPVAVGAINRALGSRFDADISAAGIFTGGVSAAAELAARLGLDDVHVITGHSHRGGPTDREARWELDRGGSLHNTGNWVFSSVFHRPGRPPNAYWPGTITWVEGDSPPRREQLLTDRTHTDLVEMVAAAKLR